MYPTYQRAVSTAAWNVCKTKNALSQARRRICFKLMNEYTAANAAE
jgi:hypothetical protein